MKEEDEHGSQMFHILCFHLSLNAYVLMHKCILSLVGSFGSYVVSMMVEF